MGYWEMALDGGYTGEEAEAVAQQLEEADRLEYEREQWRKYEEEQWIQFQQEEEYKEYLKEQQGGD